MGAFAWSQYLPGSDLDATFRKAADADRDEYGSDYYSGSIKNSHGVRRATRQICHPQEAAYLSGQLDRDGLIPAAGYSASAEERNAALAVANHRAGQLLDRLGKPAGGAGVGFSWAGSAHALDFVPSPEKGGESYGIPVGSADGFKLASRGVPVDITSLGLKDTYPYQWEIVEHLHSKLAEQLGRVPRIADISVLDDTPKYATTVTSTDGDVVTRYRIYTRTSSGALLPVNVEPQPSMAAARASVKTLLKTPPSAQSGGGGDVEYVVLGEKVRSNGAPLLIGRRELTSRFVVYKVTLVTPKPTPAAQTVAGWQVFGVSPS
jgi:hypothetical protein